jgi:glycosyltransferase involved in cell wall biosynthesis
MDLTSGNVEMIKIKVQFVQFYATNFNFLSFKFSNNNVKELVSFIVTTLNEEDYIERCLKSLKNQSYENKEIILVDSNSTDKTVEISEKYADKIIVKPCIMPVGRNLGAKEAKGDILVFVDADVILLNDWTERILPYLYEDKIGAAYGDLLPVENTPKAKFFYNLHTLSNSFLRKIGKPVFSKLGTAVAIKRDVFQTVKGYPEDHAACEDVELSLRLKKYAEIKFVPEAKGYISMRRFERSGYFNLSLKWFLTGSCYILTKKLIFSYYSKDFP